MARGIASVRLVEWTRGTGTRIAALTLILVLTVVSLLGVFVYSLVDNALRDRVRSQITQESNRLVLEHDPEHLNRLITAIRLRTRDGTLRRFAYRLKQQDGQHLAGDPWLEGSSAGWQWQELDGKLDQSISDGHVIIYTQVLDPGLVLSIGRDAHWIADVEEELRELFLWALALAISASLLISILIRRLIARRLAAVTDTALAVMDGKLTQRIPTTGAGDDFDRIAHTLNEMLDRIRALMGSLTQVTDDIAHDLRTPLGRLRQKLEQVRDDATLPTRHAAALEQAVSEADGLLATFTAMLRIAQIDSGARRSGFRPVDVTECARSVFEAYELSAEETGHSVVSNIDSGVKLNGDRDLLVQMLANLVENALTHTPSGTKIQLGVQHSAAGIEVFAADNGPGVPNGEREKIFLRFYRAEASRTTPGTGLGLSLVAAIAKLHGGTITAADNEPGLRVAIHFPTDPLA